MEVNSLWLSIALSQLIALAPMLLVYAVASILAMTKLRIHPRPAVLTLLGVGVLAVSSLVGIGVYAALAELRMNSGMEPRQSAALQGAISMALRILQAVGMGLLIAAIFSGRPKPLYPDEPRPFKA
jgi:hypothetical protein